MSSDSFHERERANLSDTFFHFGCPFYFFSRVALRCILYEQLFYFYIFFFCVFYLATLLLVSLCIILPFLASLFAISFYIYEKGGIFYYFDLFVSYSYQLNNRGKLLSSMLNLYGIDFEQLA